MCQLNATFTLSRWESLGLGHIEINGLSKPSQHYRLKSANTDGLPVDGLGFGFRLIQQFHCLSQLLYGNAGGSRYRPDFRSLESVGSGKVLRVNNTALRVLKFAHVRIPSRVAATLTVSAMN
jgi:hypothetical protein